MTRWLHNVNRIRHWRRGGNRNTKPCGWWNSDTADSDHFFIGEFVGQGRTMTHCGLVHATIQTIKDPDRIRDDLPEYDKIADDIAVKLCGHKPLRWWWSAIRAFVLFWIQIMMAFVVAITSPPIGIGCWSGSFLLFGVLSSIAFVIGFFRMRGPWFQLACLISNLISLAFLVFITLLVVSCPGVT